MGELIKHMSDAYFDLTQRDWLCKQCELAPVDSWTDGVCVWLRSRATDPAAAPIAALVTSEADQACRLLLDTVADLCTTSVVDLQTNGRAFVDALFTEHVEQLQQAIQKQRQQLLDQPEQEEPQQFADDVPTHLLLVFMHSHFLSTADQRRLVTLCNQTNSRQEVNVSMIFTAPFVDPRFESLLPERAGADNNVFSARVAVGPRLRDLLGDAAQQFRFRVLRTLLGNAITLKAAQAPVVSDDAVPLAAKAVSFFKRTQLIDVSGGTGDVATGVTGTLLRALQLDALEDVDESVAHVLIVLTVDLSLELPPLGADCAAVRQWQEAHKKRCDDRLWTCLVAVAAAVLCDAACAHDFDFEAFVAHNGVLHICPQLVRADAFLLAVQRQSGLLAARSDAFSVYSALAMPRNVFALRNTTSNILVSRSSIMRCLFFLALNTHGAACLAGFDVCACAKQRRVAGARVGRRRCFCLAARLLPAGAPVDHVCFRRRGCCRHRVDQRRRAQCVALVRRRRAHFFFFFFFNRTLAGAF